MAGRPEARGGRKPPALRPEGKARGTGWAGHLSCRGLCPPCPRASAGRLGAQTHVEPRLPGADSERRIPGAGPRVPHPAFDFHVTKPHVTAQWEELPRVSKWGARPTPGRIRTMQTLLW